MSDTTASEVKKLLTEHGWIVYRATRDAVALAERVRVNLIMEAYVEVRLDGSVRVRFTSRAQRSDFPSSSETDASLLQRARTIAQPALSLGFQEVETHVESISDPMDPGRNLDTWYQVRFENQVDSDQALLEAVQQAISFEKVAPR
ncbi:MAG: hypothetical protein ACOC1F_00285 [Myxococcota bacterium]